MKQWLTGILTLSMTVTSHAAGVPGQGTWETTLRARDLDGNTATVDAYYDTVQDITWLADANYVRLSPYASRGLVNWSDALAWVDSLNLGGYTDWRLPDTMFYDRSCDAVTSTGLSVQYFCTGSEMGHLYYNTLGNFAYSLSNTGPFRSVTHPNTLVPDSYWSATEYIDGFTIRSMSFSFDNGYQAASNRYAQARAWPVHDGDVGVNLEPDADNDSIDDLFDNCLEVANTDQSDVDLDGLGDACDPFPDSDNHEYAFCQVDLDNAVIEIDSLTEEIQNLNTSLGNCQAENQEKDQMIQGLSEEVTRLKSLIDTDADGVPDMIDECPATHPWHWNVLPNGCHRMQIPTRNQNGGD